MLSTPYRSLSASFFGELRCKITTFCRNNQIFFVLLQKIFD